MIVLIRANFPVDYYPYGVAMVGPDLVVLYKHHYVKN